MVTWLVPLCTLGGAAAGWFGEPLASEYVEGVEGRARWSRTGLAIVAALTAGVLAWRFGGTPELAAYLYLALVGPPLAFVDVAVKRLPDPLTLPSYLVGLGFLSGAALAGDHSSRMIPALAGMAALWALYALLHLISPDAIGWGDVKLAGVLGLYLGRLGLAAWWLGVFGGFVLGFFCALALLVTRRATRKSEFPFGQFMLAGALIGILLG